MSTLSAASFNAISAFFQKISGIRLTAAKQALVQSRLQRLAQECGETNLDVFVQRLVHGQLPSDVLTRVIDKLTTNETYFYREPAHFDDLAARVGRHAAGSEFAVWSAASSSGEEAFSIAMLLADKLGQAPWRVCGTDISTSVIESARQGLYPMDRAENIPQSYLKQFCLRGEGPYEGQFLMDRNIRKRVEFQCANLMRDLPALPNFDVIFLRNVLIYFEPGPKAEIVRRVMTKLKPHGVLYVGHAESLNGLGLPLKTLGPAIYEQA